MKRAFTLVEVLIVVVILGLLVGVLFQVYNSVMQISVRVEQEKTLSDDMMIFSQTLQNWTDGGKIDYDYYTGKIDLVANKGKTGILAITGPNSFLLYATGSDCTFLTPQSPSDISPNKKECVLEAYKTFPNTGYVQFTNASSLVVRNLSFTILDNDAYSPGFGYTLDIIGKNYGVSWAFDVKFFIQDFVNL